jgi:putative oxidoreductase
MLASLKSACERSLGLLHKVEWVGPLIVRLTIGLVFMSTGWGKLHNLENVTQFFASLGIPAPHANAVFVSSVELVGGVLLILGLGTRIASMFLIGVMAVAIWTAKLPELHGLLDLANTIEVAYLAAFVWIFVNGAGAASADHAIVRWMSCDTHAAGPARGSAATTG